MCYQPAGKARTITNIEEEKRKVFAIKKQKAADAQTIFPINNEVISKGIGKGKWGGGARGRGIYIGQLAGN